MKSLKGTKTEVNILTAFAGESQARNRYTFFAGKAKKDGFVQISNLFLETADQEKEHAERLFKLLEGGEVQITGSFPAGIITNTHDNLIEAAGGEHYEHTIMYPSFAKIAEEEGFGSIAQIFKNIAVAEQLHEKRYLQFAKNIKEGRVFKCEQKATWYCRNCGFTYEGTEAVDRCPACDHDKAYFQLLHNCCC
ncbi:rubrerythrin [Desulfovibrio litoralis]|uniref:Rubrerythrin n=1 Tax=Desulfovibrio litoralis DSM 11393 TaxID=1121455 RepID=A0A1M7S8L0_9BACT|nr:ferritin family protein [Desulfovibrio litoralis]SHN54806.1 Rubrerythrin [Desulfovibrio litoralis DSM 11393]